MFELVGAWGRRAVGFHDGGVLVRTWRRAGWRCMAFVLFVCMRLRFARRANFGGASKKRGFGPWCNSVIGDLAKIYLALAVVRHPDSGLLHVMLLGVLMVNTPLSRASFAGFRA